MKHKKNDMRFPNLRQILIALDDETKDKLTEFAKKNGLGSAANMVRILVYHLGLQHPEKVNWKKAKEETEEMVLAARKALYDRQKAYMSDKE